MIIRIAFKVKAPVGIAAGRGFPFGNDVIGMAGVRVRADSFFDRINFRNAVRVAKDRPEGAFGGF